MQVTEEQRQRAEANRQAALAKRKAFAESQQPQNPWALFKCQKISSFSSPAASASASALSRPRPEPAEKFLARLEICSPDSFSVTPVPVKGFPFPGEAECFRRLSDWVSQVMSTHFTQIYGGGKACVYKLSDYDVVLSGLKSQIAVEVEKIPFGTLNVMRRLSNSFEIGRWLPIRPEHLCDEEVDELIGKLPRKLLDRLLPFQVDGLRFGLQRGGRCLIADEMGVGKTLQAIAIAGCYISEGPLLVVCPAILRYSWAEELERWMPNCSPSDIHLVFGRHNNPAHLAKFPKVVVISYTMLYRLRRTMLMQDWGLLIVDESHHVRCTKKKSEPGEVKAVLDLAAKVQRIVLLSGTPSLSRPYDIFLQIDMLWPSLLGQNKYDFAKTYCDMRFVQTSEGKGFQDFSKGVRLEELNLLLRQTVMIRRLKEHVLEQLPPKRRQIIKLLLKKSDIMAAKAAKVVDSEDVQSEAAETPTASGDNIEGALDSEDGSNAAGTPNSATEDKLDGVLDSEDGSNAAETANSATEDKLEGRGDVSRARQLSYQELGIAKLSGFREWFLIHPLILEADGKTELDSNPSSQKTLIFAHHHKVLDGVQELVCEKGIGFVRIDGNTLARDRQSAVLSFQSSSEVKVAIIGITAGGVGLDFSSARNVVFLELPQSPSLMLQAEDRAHRRGQTSAVNVYIFCAKDTLDESHWRSLNRSLHRVSSTTNGKYDAVPEIEIDDVSYLPTAGETKSLQDKDSKCVPLGKLSNAEKSSLDPETSDEAPGSSISTSDTNRISSFVEVNKDDVHHESIEVLPLDLEDDPSRKWEKNVPSPDSGYPRIESSSIVDEANQDNNQCQKEQEKVFWTPDRGIGECSWQDGSVKCISMDVYSLRFEVSKYTGRIHLYSCIPGVDTRPQPLYESFRPEELESVLIAADDNKEVSSGCSGINPAYRHAILAFNDEWNKLRPVQRRKLLGKALQLPLEIELCYLNENINHNNAGLLNGGSKRRVTPWLEISHPLPSCAVWKKVQLSSDHGKKERLYTQGWTITDEPLCKLCQNPCKGHMAKTPEYFEDLFCSFTCYEEYRLRTSARSLRQELFQIEHGICANCQLDCHQLVKTIKPLSLERRKEYILRIAPRIANRKKLLDKLVKYPTEGNAWHADHIIPVYKGGGECRLENMRTLCVACHFDVTAAQVADRRLMRSKAKKLSKAATNDLKHKPSTEEIDADQEVQKLSKKDDDDDADTFDDDLLFVKVPGSAYSSKDNTDVATLNIYATRAEDFG